MVKNRRQALVQKKSCPFKRKRKSNRYYGDVLEIIGKNKLRISKGIPWNPKDTFYKPDIRWSKFKDWECKGRTMFIYHKYYNFSIVQCGENEFRLTVWLRIGVNENDPRFLEPTYEEMVYEQDCPTLKDAKLAALNWAWGDILDYVNERKTNSN